MFCKVLQWYSRIAALVTEDIRLRALCLAAGVDAKRAGWLCILSKIRWLQAGTDELSTCAPLLASPIRRRDCPIARSSCSHGLPDLAGFM